MKTFNNSDLFTGYLKQLLHDFHLPKLKVYTKKHARYAQFYGKESPEILESLESDGTKTSSNVRYFPYIKDGQIQEYVNGNWQNIKVNNIRPVAYYKYVYGDKLLNYTKNLRINSNTYDYYTHEYLGDYLRFHRDFLGLDLMPLYNCFSNRSCDRLQFKWKIGPADVDNTVVFDTTDSNYKIYMLPIKLFQKYTIAIDSASPIEMCCGVYGDYQDTRTKFKTIPQNTYNRVATSVFSQPFLYTALACSETSTESNSTYVDKLLAAGDLGMQTLIELAQNEGDLKLFIKVPVTNDSTIVVLEGDYRTWNGSLWDMCAKEPSTEEEKATRCANCTAVKSTDKIKCSICDSLPPANKKKHNYSVINIEHRFTSEDRVELVTPLQLLQLNTREQHPFADRLIEYLIGNAITNSETEIYDNIRRAQKALETNRGATGYLTGIPGLWNNEMKILFYEYMTATNLATKFNINYDLLGYVDKDVEKFYKATPKRLTSKGQYEKYKISLANFELGEDDK
jgi:hypothetical protein